MSHLLLFEDFEAAGKPRKSLKPSLIDESLLSIGQILDKSGPSRFSDFDYRHLGSTKPDVMSLLGLHFTPDKNMSEALFAGRYGFVYTCELVRGKTLKIDESVLMRDIVKFGAANNLLGTLNPALLLKLPYYEMGAPKTMAYTMIKAVKARKFDAKALRDAYVNAKLVPLGIATIEYLNNIEWARDQRYDFAVMDQKNVKITDIERPYGWNQ